MGYKLAGYDVLGCIEIDKKMNNIYLKNHKPKLNYLMDIRDFNKINNSELPKELFNLDILDGSPPCTTFSMAGRREETWGVSKKFREGQKAQTLDDLIFVFIETVHKLQPKVAIIENVEGLIRGNAWNYVKRIYAEFNKIGYQVKHWLLKGENMGIPQKRHRVFFIATRLNYDLYNLDLGFNYNSVIFEQIKTPRGSKPVPGETIKELVANSRFGERNLEAACFRLKGKNSFFNYIYVYDKEIPCTLTAHGTIIRWDTKEYPSIQDIISMSTFPQDFNFINNSYDNVSYVCGMSVPPVMIKRIALRLKETLFNNEDSK